MEAASHLSRFEHDETGDRLQELERRVRALEELLAAPETVTGRVGKLTVAEYRIAALAAAGRTNEEIARSLWVSAKTVEWNLSKVYRKLHVRSRTELAARLARERA